MRAESRAETTWVREHDVAVPMRDGVVLRADVWRPQGSGPFPVLVYRTPYGKTAAQTDYSHVREGGRARLCRRHAGRARAIRVGRRVRARTARKGATATTRSSGRRGQPWSNGSVGTFGLSYPGAVQWLAAVESPPHLKAMVPAMTFASANMFFYAGGVWDNSWAGWVWEDIAADLRRRRGVPGPTTDEEAEREWDGVRDRILWQLPLAALPDFKPIAPWYYEWMRHAPWDPWWDWADLRGKYAKTSAAVLNISGWYDEAYGPDGATTNFAGLTTTRAGGPSRSEPADRPVAAWRSSGPDGRRRASARVRPRRAHRLRRDGAALDGSLRAWHRQWRGPRAAGARLRDGRQSVARGRSVAASRDATGHAVPRGADAASRVGALSARRPDSRRRSTSSYVSNPAKPVTDPFAERSGAHDYRDLGFSLRRAHVRDAAAGAGPRGRRSVRRRGLRGGGRAGRGSVGEGARRSLPTGPRTT